MLQIGVLSDTHGNISQGIFDFLKNVDEIWHAGDIGTYEILDQLRNFKPLKFVFGNIDGQSIRIETSEYLIFNCESMKVFLMHIMGYPGHYSPKALEIIKVEKPDIIVAGHSHILKIIYDKKWEHLHLNPGAAGKSGFHKSITALRFKINGKNITDMEIWEIPKNY